MGVMKIGDGSKYQKTGTPLQKKQRRVAQIATVVFADLLPAATSAIRKKATTRRPQTVEGEP
ncbi:MAG: hypothetical protein HY268_15990 [Deltaproteobacteria bacterium]|nr:hypothetical protein [Deltaproteobacteria bacterium]